MTPSHLVLLMVIMALTLLLIAMLWGCTIRIEPLGYKPKPVAVKKTKHSTKHRHAASQDTMYVSPAWLHEYHEMEAEHGGYAIADDAKIQHEGDKVKVPRTVLKHFHDLSKITPPPPDD